MTYFAPSWPPTSDAVLRVEMIVALIDLCVSLPLA